MCLRRASVVSGSHDVKHVLRVRVIPQIGEVIVLPVGVAMAHVSALRWPPEGEHHELMYPPVIPNAILEQNHFEIVCVFVGVRPKNPRRLSLVRSNNSSIGDFVVPKARNRQPRLVHY
jgi:hypothetical protein